MELKEAHAAFTDGANDQLRLRVHKDADPLHERRQRAGNFHRRGR